MDPELAEKFEELRGIACDVYQTCPPMGEQMRQLIEEIEKWIQS